jgi:hypothetical protein
MDSEVKASGTETAAPSPGRVFVKAVALNHIHINVRDLARSVRFYREALGLVETFRPEPNLAFMSPPGSQDSLALHQGAPVGSEGLQHFGFKTHGSGSRSSDRTGATSRRKSCVAQQARRPFSLRLCCGPKRVRNRALTGQPQVSCIPDT